MIARLLVNLAGGRSWWRCPGADGVASAVAAAGVSAWGDDRYLSRFFEERVRRPAVSYITQAAHRLATDESEIPAIIDEYAMVGAAILLVTHDFSAVFSIGGVSCRFFDELLKEKRWSIGQGASEAGDGQCPSVCLGSGATNTHLLRTRMDLIRFTTHCHRAPLTSVSIAAIGTPERRVTVCKRPVPLTPVPDVRPDDHTALGDEVREGQP